MIVDGKGDFADVIKLKISRWRKPGLSGSKCNHKDPWEKDVRGVREKKNDDRS